MGGSFEEGERQWAENETAFARYKRVNIHGKILVDGHHVFLEMLRDIETFNHYVEEHPELLRGRKNIWLDSNPADVAAATGDVIGFLKGAIPLKVAQQLVGTSKICVTASAAAKGLREEAFRYCVADDYSNILIFDTRMPSVTSTIHRLEEMKKISFVGGLPL